MMERCWGASAAAVFASWACRSNSRIGPLRVYCQSCAAKALSNCWRKYRGSSTECNSCPNREPIKVTCSSVLGAKSMPSTWATRAGGAQCPGSIGSISVCGKRAMSMSSMMPETAGITGLSTLLVRPRCPASRRQRSVAINLAPGAAVHNRRLTPAGCRPWLTPIPLRQLNPLAKAATR